MRAADHPGGELDAVAYLIEQARLRCTNALAWDRPGIRAALRRSQHGDLPSLLAAGLHAASDPAARTPEAMHLAEHQARPHASSPPSPSEPVCLVCQSIRTVHDRKARLTGDHHPFDTGR